MALQFLNPPLDLNAADVVNTYDELPLWSALFGVLLLQHVPLRAGMVALDIGCGTGFPLLELARRLGPTARVVGIDPWKAALSRARRKAQIWGVRNVSVVPADAAALPLPDASVDLIVSNLGVNNMADIGVVLRECRRVARPEATLALTTNLVGHMREFYAIFTDLLRRDHDTAALQRLEAHIAHRATVSGLTAQLWRAGFAVGRVVEDEVMLRFADGTALLQHSFIKLAFLPAWLDVVEPRQQRATFERLEAALNAFAVNGGELLLTIPCAYIEATVDLAGARDE